jgi:hypothetical protein
MGALTSNHVEVSACGWYIGKNLRHVSNMGRVGFLESEVLGESEAVCVGYFLDCESVECFKYVLFDFFF